MTCERVLELSVRFLDGTLGGAERTVVSSHLEACEDCRGLVASLGEAPPEDPALTASILRRTAGPVCESARERLCAWVDATLRLPEARRLEGHLERCPACAALGRALATMRLELPRLAEGDPDPAFVAAVLARTSLKPRRAPWAERWAAALLHALDRPRIALEGAFVAAMLVVVPLGAGGPAWAAEAIRQASRNASAGLTVRAHDAWAAARGVAAEKAAGLAATLDRIAAPGTIPPAGASRHRNAEPAQEKPR